VRAWLILLAACSTDRELVVMPEPPLDDGARSLVIVFEGETTFLYAIDLAERSTPLLQVESPWMSTELAAVAFSFDRPLAFYGLPAGRLAPVESSRSCALQSPRAVVEYDPSARVWNTLDPPVHPSLGKLVDETTYGCDAIDLCRTFSREVVEISSSLNVDVLLRLDEQTALFSVERGGGFFEITRGSDPVERTDLRGLPDDSGIITESGEIWLGGPGRFARGRREGGFVETQLGAAEEVFTAFGVREEGPELEALAVSIIDLEDVDTATISVYRFFEGTWNAIGRMVEEKFSTKHSHVFWIDERAVILFGGTYGLIWTGTGLVPFSVQSPLPLFEPELNAIAMREDFGLVLGTNDGFLYKMEGTLMNWIPIREGILGNGIHSVHPAFEGFVYGGPDGTFNQFYPGSIPCTSERLVMSDVDRIVVLGRDILASGGNPARGDEPNTLTWLSAAD
jgi:hypothetical protein